jgi:hypothetical protein
MSEAATVDTRRDKMAKHSFVQLGFSMKLTQLNPGVNVINFFPLTQITRPNMLEYL